MPFRPSTSLSSTRLSEHSTPSRFEERMTMGHSMTSPSRIISSSSRNGSPNGASWSVSFGPARKFTLARRRESASGARRLRRHRIQPRGRSLHAHGDRESLCHAPNQRTDDRLHLTAELRYHLAGDVHTFVASAARPPTRSLDFPRFPSASRLTAITCVYARPGGRKGVFEAALFRGTRSKIWTDRIVQDSDLASFGVPTTGMRRSRSTKEPGLARATTIR